MAEQFCSEAAGKTGASLLRNTLWLAFSGAVNIANSLALWLALARWREAAEVGQFSAVLSLYTIFSTVCTLGLGPYLTSEIARRRERGSFVASAAVVICCWSLVCTVAMVVTGYLVSDAETVRLASVVLSLAVLPTGLLSVAEAVLLALGRARVIACAATLENVLRLALPLWLLYRGYGLPAICLALAAVRLAAGAVYVCAGWRWLGELRLAAGPLLREIAIAAPTFAGVTILAAVHWQIGAVLVSRWGGETAAAEFGVAIRFLLPVTILLVSFVNVAQPVAARLAGEALEKLNEFLARSLQIVIALGLPLAAGGVLLGRELLTLLFGMRYAGAAAALGLLALSIIPFGVVMIAARGLIATGRQRLDFHANLAAVASNVLLNWLLIPRYGAAGAAAAQLVSVTVMAAIEAGFGFTLNVKRALWTCRWPLAAMLVVIWQTQRFGFWWALLGGGVSYLLGLALIWERLRPTEQGRTRVLLVGDHLTKTKGGISTLLCSILHSPLTQEFEFQHIASQADEYSALGKLGLALTALCKFAALIVWRRPAVVWIHVGCSASLYRKAVFSTVARLLGQRVLVHFHAGNFEAYLARQNALGRWLIVHGLGQAGRFIAVSREMERMLKRYWPAAEIAYVPNGVRLARFAGPRAEQAEVRLLFVGKMGALKGEADLLPALQRLAQQGLAFRFDLLGSLSATIAEQCRAAGLETRLDQLGPVALSECPAFYQRADIFVLPSYAEGLPVAVLEALAARLPIVTTPVGGIPELIADGVEGYLVAPGDVDALAEKLARLIRNPEERRLMGERAQAKAREFDEELMWARLGTQLRRVAQAYEFGVPPLGGQAAPSAETRAAGASDRLKAELQT